MREEELYWLRQLDRYAEALERVARRLQTKGAGRYADASHDASLWRGMAAAGASRSERT